ncbi:MAG: SMP-30/gluconolactonase/LRE family protein [Gemmatimonadaceae bacterium]
MRVLRVYVTQMAGAGLLCWMVVGAPALAAQSYTGIPAVDSAAVARAAWERATKALYVHDVAAARTEVAHAASAWPTQPAYLWARAVTAQLASDSNEVLAALTTLADLGMGRDLASDARFSGYARTPRFSAIVARLDSNRAPLVRSRVVATLVDSTFWPEGMDYDPRRDVYYVASVRHGTIAEVVQGVVTREMWPRDRPGFGSVLGVRVDTMHNVLWATLAGIPQRPGFAPTDSVIAALVRVRIADGAVERRWDLPPARLGHVLGDLAIGPHGDIFVTDSNDPVLYRLRPDADTLERIASPLFRSLQGAAPLPNGRVLYVADYSHGLLRVDLDEKTVTRLRDAPRSTSLGCDGIAWDGHGIICVQNGVSPARIMRFVVDATGRSIERAEVLDRNPAIADEPTIGAVVGGEFVYVANSQWEKYTDDGKRKYDRPLTAPILLGVSLRLTDR